MSLTRRQFISGAVAVGASGVALAAVNRLGTSSTSSPIGNVVTDSVLDPFITPVSDFYRTDTILGELPSIDAAKWSLRIHGMVEREVTLTLADINALPQVSNVITLGCISNSVGGELIGNAEWGGVLLADVLKSCGIDSASEQLVSTSVDGWTCGTPVDAVMDGRPAMLATRMNGEALRPVHGYPVRMVVPGLFGYVSATKWVTDIEVTTWNAFDAYWVRNGWAKEGPFLASSRIDLPRQGARVVAGVAKAGGFAWAPMSGVKSVELRVDSGEWQPMTIVPGGNPGTWCQWTGEWIAQPGEHTLTVRVVGNDGVAQVEEIRPPEPSGATGLHSVAVTVA